jgi:hypothetical protein
MRMTDRSGESRELTAAVRAELGLSKVIQAPYRWAFASLVVGTACVPLMIARMWKSCVVSVVIGFVVLPLVRWFERRDAARREDVYRFGIETVGRVLDVEPAAPGRSDHIVRVEFRAEGAIVRASVIGCPLARRGLLPDDDVVVLHAPDRPERCLVVRKVAREVVDAIFDD